MASLPTQRTLKMLRDSGAAVQVVERWCSFSKRRIDLFGCIDIVSIRAGTPGATGYQACAGNSHAIRRTKILAIPAAKLWVECGNRLFVVSWRKSGARGKKKLWTPRLEEITIGMFDDEPSID